MAVHCCRLGQSALDCGSSGSARRSPGKTVRRTGGRGSRWWSGGPCPLSVWTGSLAVAGLFGEVPALAVFGLFAGVEGADGAVVAHDAGPDFAALAAFLGEALVFHFAVTVLAGLGRGGLCAVPSWIS